MKNETLNYQNRIAELKQILSEKQETEEDEEITNNQEFNAKKIKLQKEQKQEMKILEEELSKLQNNEANIELPVELTNSIIQDISSQINKCLQYYEKNIIIRLDKIKENINKKSPKIINDEFNKILNVIKDNNDKLFDDFSKKQMEIKEKINQMAKDLNIKIEKNNENEKKTPLQNIDNNIANEEENEKKEEKPKKEDNLNPKVSINKQIKTNERIKNNKNIDGNQNQNQYKQQKMFHNNNNQNEINNNKYDINDEQK